MNYLLIINQTYLDCFKEIEPDKYVEITSVIPYKEVDFDNVMYTIPRSNNYLPIRWTKEELVDRFPNHIKHFMEEHELPKLKLLLL
jgi:hypothetical protein